MRPFFIVARISGHSHYRQNQSYRNLYYYVSSLSLTKSIFWLNFDFDFDTLVQGEMVLFKGWWSLSKINIFHTLFHVKMNDWQMILHIEMCSRFSFQEAGIHGVFLGSFLLICCQVAMSFKHKVLTTTLTSAFVLLIGMSTDSNLNPWSSILWSCNFV